MSFLAGLFLGLIIGFMVGVRCTNMSRDDDCKKCKEKE